MCIESLTALNLDCVLASILLSQTNQLPAISYTQQAGRTGVLLHIWIYIYIYQDTLCISILHYTFLTTTHTWAINTISQILPAWRMRLVWSVLRLLVDCGECWVWSREWRGQCGPLELNRGRRYGLESYRSVWPLIRAEYNHSQRKLAKTKRCESFLADKQVHTIHGCQIFWGQALLLYALEISQKLQ